MDQGRNFTFEIAAYPRYHYLLDYQRRYIERWEKILDLGSLPDCISQGRSKLKKISAAANELDETVQVNVFAELSFLNLNLSSILLHCNPKVSAETTSITWTDFVESWKTGNEPIVAVLVVEKGKELEDIVDKLSDLPERLKKSIIVYFDKSQSCSLYDDLGRSNTDEGQTRLVLTDSKMGMSRPALNTQIQLLLEDRVVDILEQIAAYNRVFVPRKECGLFDTIAIDVHHRVKAALGDKFVVKDLSPYRKEREKRQDEHVDNPDKIFHEKLLEFVSKKTKCTICELLSLKFGISTSLLNEFLNDGFYGYDKKIEDMFAGLTLPSFPPGNDDNGLQVCEMFATSCYSALTKLVKEVEQYIQTKYTILLFVKKLQFQIHGILVEADVPLQTAIPRIPKLPKELQHDLLELSYVHACGTIWGDLVVHVKEELLPEQRTEVRNKIEEHMYFYGFRTEVIKSEAEDTLLFSPIEHGCQIRASLRNACANDFKYGSVGCFVSIKAKSDVASNAPLDTEKTLHALTCAHCVDGCDVIIDIHHRDDFIKLGEIRHVLYEPQALDVATVAVEIEPEKCCTTLKNAKKQFCKTWKMIDEPPMRMPVFKHGCATGLTHGTCVSSNYQTKTMIKRWNAIIALQENQNGEQFCPFHNVLISKEDVHLDLGEVIVEKENTDLPYQGNLQPEIRAKEFSQAGDSGSVICKTEAHSDVITAVSLLLGTVKTSEGSYCYSAHLYRNLEELGRRSDCIIEPDFDQIKTRSQS